jgi:uncharacterized membrane protein (DUF373 family)
MTMKSFNYVFSMKASKALSRAAFGLLGLGVAVIFFAILASIIRVGYDLRLFFHADIEAVIRQVIVDFLSIFALVEILKTVQAYLEHGRIQVTYVVDTILILLLNEILSAWYQHMDVQTVAILLTLLAFLIIMRIITIRFSPEDRI